MTIIYIGKVLRYNGIKRKPENMIPRLRQSGTKVYRLPVGRRQLKGFEHPDAKDLLRLWPRHFKLLIKKGD